MPWTSLPARNLELDELQELVDRLAGEPERWRQHVSFSDAERVFVSLYRDDFVEEPERETLTFRNSAEQTALPMRHIGSFRPAVGAGGAGVHWNGQTWRFLRRKLTSLPRNAFLRRDLSSRPGRVVYERR